MNLEEIINQLNLMVLTEPRDFSDVTPTSGYVSDMLSCVMAGAQHGAVWVTLQSHINIVAVAAILELSAVIITENAIPDSATIARANEEGIILLSSNKTSFFITGMLWDMGIRAN
jgi:hypothetical protein